MQYIINADDFGRTETVNKAIVYGFDNEYLSRTTIMVNMPYFDQAVQLAKDHGFFDKVGLHINLTSGTPLTENIKKLASFADEEGNFNGKIFKNTRLMLFLSAKERKYVREEIEAQVKKYIQNGFTLKHADSHGHIHTCNSLINTVLSVLRQYEFKSARISLNIHSQSWLKKTYKKHINNKIIHRMSMDNSSRYYFGSLKDVVKMKNEINSSNSVCEIMLHPNIYDGDMQIGEWLHYEDINKINGDS